MANQEQIILRLEQLVADARMLEGGTEDYDGVRSTAHRSDCAAWVAASQHAVHLLCPSPQNAFRVAIDKLAGGNLRSATINQTVGSIGRMLERLLDDVRDGLLASLVDHAHAEVFADFLDAGKEYQRRGRKNEAGVIAGVVFEDTLRRLCDKHQVTQQGQPLEQLISALAQLEVISATKSKRARVAAHVRTKATHAQWDEFDTADVTATIELAGELIQLLDA